MLAVAIVGAVSTFIGINSIGRGIISQAQNRVSADLNSAGEIYKQFEQQVSNVCRFTATRYFLRDAIIRGRRKLMIDELRRVMSTEDIDFLSLTDEKGRVIARATNADAFGDDLSWNPVIRQALSEKKPVVSTEIFDMYALESESGKLASQAVIRIIPTARAKYQREGNETTGMVIFGAAPITDDAGKAVAVIYAGKLISNNYQIVDKTKNTVFMNEKYEGKDIGTATIFMKDLRVSTNVMNQDGTRAIGTLISREVYEAVIEKGLVWMARAFVVNDWYITAYRPIRNAASDIIGVLYVGILEKKYTDMRNQIIGIFVGVTFFGMLVVFGFSYFLAGTITRPLSGIAHAARKIAQGDFPEKIEVKTRDEIADLGKAFQFMITSIKKRDEELKDYAQRTVAEAERLAIIGQLAAGVAHEINNPLTGILLYCDILLKAMPRENPQRERLEKISNEAKRCKTIVKGLLDFARQKKPEIKASSINQILEATLSLLSTQAIFMNVNIRKELDPGLPMVNIDPSQIQQVFINTIMNAVEAMDGKGDLVLETGLAQDGKSIEIRIRDSGPGIARENQKRIFEPFFTTKESMHGVGLGLSICQWIVEAHNGKISVTSEVGKGATFMIRLPQ
jgi:two-component system NtrC family sensor kinase